jgi:hypothetical protein
MRRSAPGVAVLTISILMLVALPAAAAAPSLPTLFAKQINAIHAARRAPSVLLPSSMPLDARHLYPSGGPSGATYDLELGAVKNCGGADACFVADFTAAKGNTVFGRRVTVRGASKAGFKPLSCGASCSPPAIDFIVHGIRYEIQANLKTKQSDKAALIKAAQGAISAGPR